jgi:hypothetical protein
VGFGGSQNKGQNKVYHCRKKVLKYLSLQTTDKPEGPYGDFVKMTSTDPPSCNHFGSSCTDSIRYVLNGLQLTFFLTLPLCK